MAPEEQVGPRLRALRKALGVTLEVLAERSGHTKGYLSKIETGKKLPPIATLSRISDALGSDIAYFFQREPAWDAFDGRVSLVRAGERRQAIRGGSTTAQRGGSIEPQASRHMRCPSSRHSRAIPRWNSRRRRKRWA